MSDISIWLWLCVKSTETIHSQLPPKSLSIKSRSSPVRLLTAAPSWSRMCTDEEPTQLLEMPTFSTFSMDCVIYTRLHYPSMSPSLISRAFGMEFWVPILGIKHLGTLVHLHVQTTGMVGTAGVTIQTTTFHGCPGALLLLICNMKDY